MKRKFKNAIRDSFSFPEAAKKEDFFRQVEGSHVSKEKNRNNLPIIFRFSAAIAAAVIGIGVWGVLNGNPALNGYDYNRDTLTVTAVQTETEGSSTVLTTAVTTSSLNITESTSSAETQKPTNSATSAVHKSEAIPTITTLLTTAANGGSSVTTNQNPPEIIDERSYYMKKLAAFTSALTIIAASGSMNANAVYQPPTIADEDQAVIDYIDNNNIDIDFDCDGEFTLNDAYALECYENYNVFITDEVKALCEANGDINNDGVVSYADYETLCKNLNANQYGPSEIDFDGDGEYSLFDELLLDYYTFPFERFSEESMEKCAASGDLNNDGLIYSDSRALIKYYILKNGIQREFFEQSYYVSDDVYVHGNAGIGSMVRYYSDVYDLGVITLTEKVKNGEISLDFNDDGEENMLDGYFYYTYIHLRDNNSADLTEIMSGESGFDLSTWMNCVNFDTIRPDGTCYTGNGGSSWSPAGTERYGLRVDYYAVVKYFLYNSKLTPEMLTGEYYAQHCGIKLNANNSSSIGFATYINNFAGAEGIVPVEESDFNDDLFWEYYYKYEADTNSGAKAAPDVNLDGVVDYKDYYDSNILLSERMKDVPSEESLLSAEVRKNLDENCDLNDNGESGDLYDITIVQMYVLKSDAEAPENISEAYDAYVESISPDTAAAEYTADLMYDRQFELLSTEQNILVGDANDNGFVEVADAVYILQNIADPGNTSFKRSITEERQANCYNPEDSGVDSQDALAIQQHMAGMLDTLPV